MALLLQSLQQVERIQLNLRWHTVNWEDMRHVTGILSNHQCQDIELRFIEFYASHEVVANEREPCMSSVET